MGGKAPQAPSDGPQAKDQVSLTDEESRIMPTPNGFEQAYNAQASVDIATHLIVTHHVTQHTNDKQEITPVLAKLGQLPAYLGTVDSLLADTGYFSQGNVEACVDATIKPYIAQKRQSHNPPLEARFQHQPEIDETTLPPVEAMTHRLSTKTGKAVRVESPEGASPSGSHRTVREPLDSYGSSYSSPFEYTKSQCTNNPGRLS
ncbi:MAG: transposase, partial [Methylococcaceae bacterium]|nr:transposase [Methylococcaceae bacterium]MDZ4157162.1 transposase [Methylococcales bacterium]MDP2394878.1 transposase [Methylococcaceae bacterium]MDP3020299.1 transposase [Methylococcaceae bacterium]MDP3390840.1 transposase [Methylococcaceae bacterium]